MNDLALTLRLNADGSGLVGTLRVSEKEVEKFKKTVDVAGASSAAAGGKLDAHGKEAEKVGKKSRRAGRDLDNYSKDADKAGNASKRAGNSVRGLAGRFGSLRGMLATLGIGITANEMQAVVAAGQDLDTRISGLTASAQAYREEQDYLYRTAKDLHQDIDVLTDSYARLLSLQKSGITTQEESRAILEGLSDAAIELAASNVQVQQVMYGLSQALSSPIVRAEELNQVVEPLPGLLAELDRAAGLSAGGFRRMVIDGEVTSAFFKETLIEALDAYQGAAERTGDNLNRVYADIATEYKQLVRELAKPLKDGLANMLRGAEGALISARENIDGIRTAATVGGAALGAFAAVKLLTTRRAETLTSAIRQQYAAHMTNLNGTRASALMLGGSYTAAQTAGTVATRAHAAALTGMTLAGRGAAAVLGALGGPAGAIIIGVSAIAAWALSANDAASATDNWREDVERLNSEMGGFTTAQIEAEIEAVTTRITALRKEMNAPSNGIMALFGKDVAGDVEAAQQAIWAFEETLQSLREELEQGAFERLRAQIDPAYQSLSRLADMEFQLAEAAEAGRVSQEDLARLLDLLHRRFDDTAKATGEANKNLARYVAQLKEQHATLGMNKTQLRNYQTEQALVGAGDANLVQQARQLTAQINAKAAAIQRAKDAAKEKATAIKAWEDRQKSLVRTSAAGVKELDREIARQKAHNATIGKTREQIQLLEIARLEDAAASKERAAAVAEENGEDGEHIFNLLAQADKFRELADLKREAIGKQAQADAQESAKKAAEDAAEESTRAWTKSAEIIEQTLTDRLMRAFERGEGFAEAFASSVKDLFKTLVLRPTVQYIAQGAAGTVMSALGMPGAPSASAEGGGGSMLGMLQNGVRLYNTASTLGTLASGYMASGASLAAYSGAVGSAMAAGAGVSQAAMLASQTAVFGSQGAALTGAALGAGGGASATAFTMASALPILLPIAILAIGALMKKKPSDKAQWGNLDLSTLETSDMEGFTGKKYSKEVADARDQFIGFTSSYAETLSALTGDELSGHMRVVMGQRDGVTVITGQENVEDSYGNLRSTGETFSDSEEAMRYALDFIFTGWLEATDKLTESTKNQVAKLMASLEELEDYSNATAGVVGLAGDLENDAGVYQYKGEDLQTLQDAYNIIDELAQRGEAFSDAYARIKIETEIITKGFEKFGATLGLVGKEAVTAIDEIVRSAGGAESAAAGFAALSDPATTSDNIRALVDTFHAAGVAIPHSIEQYREQLAAIDNTTEAGRKQTAALLALAPAYKQVHDALLGFKGSLLGAAKGRAAPITAEQFAEKYDLDAVPDAVWLSTIIDDLESADAGEMALLVGYLDNLGISADEAVADINALREQFDATAAAAAGFKAALLNTISPNTPTDSATAFADKYNLDFTPDQAWLNDVEAWLESASADDMTALIATLGEMGITADEAAADLAGLIQSIEDASEAAAEMAEELLAASIDLLKSLTQFRQQLAADIGMETSADLATMRSELYSEINLYDTAEVSQRLELARQYRAALIEQINAEDKLLQARKRASEGLLDLVNKLRIGNISGLSPVRRLSESRAQYEALLTAANAGDTDAAAQVGKSAQEYLRLAAAYSKSGSEYRAVFGEVTNALENLGHDLATDDLTDIQRHALDELRLLHTVVAAVEHERLVMLHVDLIDVYGAITDLPQGIAEALAPYLDKLNDIDSAAKQAASDRKGTTIAASAGRDKNPWLRSGDIKKFSGGGISTGPTSGYMAELHGTEAVIPIPNGAIPVQIDYAALIAAVRENTEEVKALRIENRAFGAAQVKGVNKTAATLRKWNNDGMPGERVA